MEEARLFSSSLIFEKGKQPGLIHKDREFWIGLSIPTRPIDNIYSIHFIE